MPLFSNDFLQFIFLLKGVSVGYIEIDWHRKQEKKLFGVSLAKFMNI
tara:strand:- start:169 stop:309 length:141 start_codon:yes stop_codon:yes gene_type:complete